jgi:hypothetical protein
VDWRTEGGRREGGRREEGGRRRPFLHRKYFIGCVVSGGTVHEKSTYGLPDISFLRKFDPQEMS